MTSSTTASVVNTASVPTIASPSTSPGKLSFTDSICMTDGAMTNSGASFDPVMLIVMVCSVKPPVGSVPRKVKVSVAASPAESAWVSALVSSSR